MRRNSIIFRVGAKCRHVTIKWSLCWAFQYCSVDKKSASAASFADRISQWTPLPAYQSLLLLGRRRGQNDQLVGLYRECGSAWRRGDSSSRGRQGSCRMRVRDFALIVIASLISWRWCWWRVAETLQILWHQTQLHYLQSAPQRAATFGFSNAQQCQP